MIEIVKSILHQPAGSFAFVFGLLFLAGWLIHYVTKFTTKWRCDLNSSADKVGKVENNIDSIKADISYIKGMIGILQSGVGTPLTQSHSPISLTEAGKQLALEIGVQEMIANNWEHINALIRESTKSKNAYDIQQFCIETATISCEKMFTAEDVSKLKNFAFNAGKPLAYYGSKIGVIIRDKYIAENGILVSEVDRHDPNRQERK